MVNSSTGVVDGVVSIRCVLLKLYLHFFDSTVEVLENVCSMVQTHVPLSLCVRVWERSEKIKGPIAVKLSMNNSKEFSSKYDYQIRIKLLKQLL